MGGAGLVLRGAWVVGGGWHRQNVWVVVVVGGGGAQCVRFASLQLAPTAPATTVFVALSSVCQIMFCVFTFRLFNGWGHSQGPFLPYPLYQVSSRLSGCVRGKHSAARTPVCLVDPLAGPFLCRVRGVCAGSGSLVGGHLQLLAPFGHTLRLHVFGPWAYGPCGYG